MLSYGYRAAFLLLLLPVAAFAQPLAAPGPGPVGPADPGATPARIGEIVEPPPRRGYTDDVRAAKDAARAARSKTRARDFLLGPREPAAANAPAAPGLNATFGGNVFLNDIPPDPVIAASDEWLVTVTNGSLNVFRILPSYPFISNFGSVSLMSLFDRRGRRGRVCSIHASSSIPAAGGSSSRPSAASRHQLARRGRASRTSFSPCRGRELRPPARRIGTSTP